MVNHSITLAATDLFRENTSFLTAVLETGDGLDSSLSPTADIALSLYLAILMLMTILLNTIVLLTKYRSKKVTPVDCYIIALSTVDIVQAVLGHPWVMAAASRHRWPTSPQGCEWYAAFVYGCGCVDIYILLGLCVVRYIKTCFPNLDRFVGHGAVLISLFVSILFAAMWALMPFLSLFVDYVPEPFGLSCTLDFVNMDIRYLISIFTCVYLVPITLMMFCYGSMIRTLRAATKNSHFTHSKQLDIHLTKMSCAMCGTFLFCWTPYAIVTFTYAMTADTTRIPLWISVVAPIVAKSAGVFNPVVYFLMVQRYRQDAIKMLTSMFKIRTQEEKNSSPVIESDTQCIIENEIALIPTSGQMEVLLNKHPEVTEV